MLIFIYDYIKQEKQFQWSTCSPLNNSKLIIKFLTIKRRSTKPLFSVTNVQHKINHHAGSPICLVEPTLYVWIEPLTVKQRTERERERERERVGITQQVFESRSL